MMRFLLKILVGLILSLLGVFISTLTESKSLILTCGVFIGIFIMAFYRIIDILNEKD